jgi:hypothetical protein
MGGGSGSVGSSDGFFDFFPEVWIFLWILLIIGIVAIVVAVYILSVTCLAIGLVLILISSVPLYFSLKGMTAPGLVAQQNAYPYPPGYAPPPPGYAPPPQGTPYYPPQNPQVHYPYNRPYVPTPNPQPTTCPSCGGQVFAGRAYCPHCSAPL